MLRKIIPGPLFVGLQRMISGFLFLPSLIALSGVLMAFLIVWVDRRFFPGSFPDWLGFLNINATGARTVLDTIAGATMTVISLVYSLTLVVFTLAAANIGPRLLENFTNNRVNQVTIGLLSATFLYALIVLYIVGEEEVPKLSVAAAIVLVTISLFTLIYFVHDAARSVKVDSEIARTQKVLRREINRLLTKEPAEDEDDARHIPDGHGRPIRAPRPGYITAVDTEELCRLARLGDGFITMTAQLGDYVVKDETMGELVDCGEDCTEEDACRAILLADARAPDGDIKFNIHLAVEIAIRALSPGINDSYTAISALDQMSGSLAMLLQRGIPSPLHRDKDDTPRVWMPIMEIADIVGTALHPLRRASQGNMLVTLRLVHVIGKLRRIAHDRHDAVLTAHLRHITEDGKRHVTGRHDRSTLAEAIRAARARNPETPARG
ncbi:DUF2254 domain-containing protein [Algicella marina]|uniref:DUF2254 domain-containing protein n=1 Tax=Algicella marina TaxID=2683284 RepID=A0A6P1SZS6_9RHOB|nr:DUF2254 domain-containing protein [Algicella marina]QHQ35025.1 DUF2254 domain-containing protein [Algicella marina]